MYRCNISTPAIEFGKQLYETTTKRKLKSCGVLVCVGRGKGFLAASSDGLVANDKIMETKFPYLGRNLKPDDKPTKNRKFSSTLRKGRQTLKTSHNYYFQI